MQNHPLFKFLFSYRTAGFILIGISIFFFFRVGLSTHQQNECGVDINYRIFKGAHFHLLGDQDLYSYHPTEHCYTYKYSPTFALVFGCLAYLPNWLGILIWTLSSAILVLVAIQSLPGFTETKKSAIVYFMFFEYWTSALSLQTNVMIVSLLLIAFVQLEKKHYLVATLLIVGTGFVKIFGFGVIALFLFYPHKPKLIVYTLVWTLLFFLLPLLVVPWNELLYIYNKWWEQISNDYGFAGLSVYTMVYTITGFALPKLWVLVLSLGVMLGSFFQTKKWKETRFKLLCLAALFIWFVCFNHKSESATYIISIMGIGIWYFSRTRKWPDHILAILSFFILSVCFSDLVPKYVKFDIGFKYHLKALPSLIIWIRIIAELWVDPFKKIATTHQSTLLPTEPSSG